jgi:uncharacterized protein (TIGR00266 family)
MTSMDAGVELTSGLNGGFPTCFVRKYLGGESLFRSVYKNVSRSEQRLVLTQSVPGDIKVLELDGSLVWNLQSGAFLASEPPVKFGVSFAGLGSWIAKEGLFKQQLSGQGLAFYGGFGALVEKQVEGEYIVDSSHLIAYEPSLKLKVQMAGGLMGSLLGGEGLVLRLVGDGKIIVQSRSLKGVAGWLNPKLP